MTGTESSLLREILQVLHEMMEILILTNQDKLAEVKKRLLPKASVKERIYELCNGSRGTSFIARTIRKSEAYVRANLSDLRKEGLVRAIDKNGEQVHEKVF